MCGICGIVRLDGGSVDPGALDRLTDALAHRGPDGRGTWIDRGVGLGHRRLSILDLTEAAAQPMQSDNSDLVLVFNGEIYNYAEKRRLLESKGHRFRSTGDTEVLLRLYEEFGEDCLLHLRGMFAFAVFDRRKNSIFLARDRVGKKPVKYFHMQGMFAFASEWKALRTLSECPRGIDTEAIHHYLTMMYLPSPFTGVVGIHKLPSAHCMRIDIGTGKETIRRYWSPQFEPDESKSAAQWEDDILRVLDESVRLRMVADVPVGAFLSGGLDSAAVTALMARHSSRSINTFSIGSGVDAYNELPDAERMARFLHTNHHPIVLSADILGMLPELVHSYEEPYADPAIAPAYLLARETRKFVTVALNGDGGDENFAGYIRFPILNFSRMWARQPSFVHTVADAATALFDRFARTTLSYRCRRFQQSIHLPWEQRYLQYLSFFTEEEKRSLERDELAAQFPRTDQWFAERTRLSRLRATDLLHQAISMDFDTYLPDDLMPKIDLGTMANSLEARSPLLDHELLELTARIPARFKLRGFERKIIFKHALRDLLPAATLRRRKTGFRMPLDHWFRTDAKAVVDGRLLRSDSKLWSFFRRDAMERFLREYRSSSVDFSDHVWSLLWLDEWLTQYT